MVNALGRARKFNITEVTVIGPHLVGLSRDGALYRQCGTRWVRLEVANQFQKHARRLVKYSGHFDSTRSVNA